LRRRGSRALRPRRALGGRARAARQGRARAPQGARLRGLSVAGSPGQAGEYAAELAAARSLAIGGGEIVMRWTAGGFRVDDKAGQPVTQADHESNAFIVDGLSKRFPADAILAEETPVTDGAWRSAERCWVVDPLDGTSDFVKGRVGFCVMIGLLVRGRPVLGAVNVPKAGRMFLGAVGAGAFEERGAQLDGCEERR